VAKAVGIGIFIGCLPIYGLHIVCCVAAARWLRLNQALMYAAANVSNPVFAPFLIGAEIAVGEWIRHGRVRGFDEHLSGNVLQMASQGGDLFLSCLIGSVVIGIVLGLAMAALSHEAARRWLPPASALPVPHAPEPANSPVGPPREERAETAGHVPR
jgi:uncharacterized protein (DUF2062 family)